MKRVTVVLTVDNVRHFAIVDDDVHSWQCLRDKHGYFNTLRHPNLDTRPNL